ncbi:MAG: HD-GYP domain-containing protein [Candidatus Aminicenantia bacterium]
MEKIKEFLLKHFEKILVLSVLLGIVAINYFASYKIAFLNFFYLPIIAAGYYVSKRMAVLTAVFCVLVVILFIILFPSSFFIAGMDKIYAIVSLTAWSCFLILTSAALGYLYDEKEKRIKDLKAAYIGIIEILSKYLESADRYTQEHSIRVAHLSEDIANAMGLPEFEIENIKAAALLHDIGKTEISMNLVNKAASLTTTEKELIDLHSERGARIISLVGGVLKEAVPIVLAHHKYYFELKKFSSEEIKSIPIGTAIIAVADAYDALVTDRPYRAGKPPWKAFEEIEKESGKQFHPEVVKAFKQVLIANEKYREEDTI